MSEYDADAFDAYESAGWEAVAETYDSLWSPITRQAADPLLDAAGVVEGTRLVDIGSGSGDAAGRAVERGAQATGVDVAAAMVAIAARRHPSATFVEASAASLPFPDASFDAAVGNIVIQHIGEPAGATQELARVLVPGGRVALSTWDSPERSPFFAVLLGAIGEAGVPPPGEVPPGPSFFQFADDVAFRSLLADAGFADVEIESIAVDFPLRSADEVITALAEGTVRTGALIRAATEEQRDLARAALEIRLEPWRQGSGYAVPAGIKIAHGKKPA